MVQSQTRRLSAYPYDDQVVHNSDRLTIYKYPGLHSSFLFLFTTIVTQALRDRNSRWPFDMTTGTVLQFRKLHTDDMGIEKK
jgi:hypothetical protein